MKCKLTLCWVVMLWGASFSVGYSQDRYLLVVDVQSMFYNDAPLVPHADTMLSSINEVIQSFDPQKVVYVLAKGRVLSISFKGIKVEPMDSMPVLDSNLLVVSSYRFTKVKADAFSVDALNQFFAQRNVKDIVVVGLIAEECIYSTALGGLRKGYNMYVVPNALGSRSQKKKAQTIKKLIKHGVQIYSINNNS